MDIGLDRLCGVVLAGRNLFQGSCMNNIVNALEGSYMMRTLGIKI